MTGRANSSGYGRDEMRELLAAGARLEDRPSAAAAMHLLTFTDLPAAGTSPATPSWKRSPVRGRERWRR